MRRPMILCLVLLLASLPLGADASAAGFRLLPPDSGRVQSLAPLVVVLPAREATPASGTGARSAFEVLTSAAVRRRHPAYILSVRPPTSGDAASGLPVDAPALASVLESILGDYPIDPDRVYIVGEFSGADAAWKLLSDLPGVFAAGVSLGGVTDPETASRITDVALWVFHGENDERVSVGRVRSMIGAIWSAGAIDVRYTEVREEGQDIRSTAWAESRLLPWLFSQSRE